MVATKIEEQVLNLFINNIPQFVFWKDRNSVYLGCNNNFVRTAGFTSKEEIIGKTDYDMPWSTEEADFFRKIDQEVMNSAKPQLNFEERQTLSNGDKRWLSTSKMPLFDESNVVIGIIGWYIDITDYKLMEIQIDEKNKALLEYNLQLEKSKEALELANYDLEKFTYAASHDLKTPIRTIVSFAQLLRRKMSKNLDEVSTEYIDFIINSGQRMNNLVKDILTYARTGSQELICQETILSELVSTKVDDLKQVIQSKSAKINIDLPKDPINCYPHLIGIVFYNMINNAIKFNESETPTVDCYYTESSEDWLFSIRDNGIGIDLSSIDKVFEPFQRLVKDEYEGSGIGLSICKRVINLHKGKIWIENNPTGGTIFNFSISKHLQ